MPYRLKYGTGILMGKQNGNRWEKVEDAGRLGGAVYMECWCKETECCHSTHHGEWDIWDRYANVKGGY